MNKFILIVGLFVIGFTSCNAPENSTKEVNGIATEKKAFTNVSVAELQSAIQKEHDVIVLDVRTVGEVSEGYVPLSINIDVKDENFKNKVLDLNQETTVYVYCRSGHRSQIASEKLIELGFSDVRNVEGGFMAWEQGGFDIAQ